MWTKVNNSWTKVNKGEQRWIKIEQRWTNDEISDPNCVLVETDKSMYAKNFARVGNFTNPMRHIGIYGYSYKILNNLVNLEPTKNELEFKLEQLRFLENNWLPLAAFPIPPGTLSILAEA